MHNILVSIEADLPSSIALRYACRLAGLTQAKVQVLHVKEPDEAGPAVGAGWARLTWQKELLTQANQEITQILRDDLNQCSVQSDPIVAVGDREHHVLAELGRKTYDLLVEGLPAPPSPSALSHVLRSEILHKTHCPVLLALTMAPLKRALVCLDEQGAGHVECFARLMQGSDLVADLLALDFSAKERAEDPARLEKVLDEAKRVLEGHDLKVGEATAQPGKPEALAGVADQYGLLVVPLLREAHQNNPWVAQLGNVSTSMLLC